MTAGMTAGTRAIEHGLDGERPDGADVPSFDEGLLASLMVAAGLLAGLLVPDLAATMAPALLPSLFVIAVGSLLPFRAMFASSLLSFDRQVVIVVAWLQIGLPLLVLAGGKVLGAPSFLLPFVLVSACSGSVFAAPTLAGLFGLDRGDAARIMVLSTVLMPMSLCVFVGPFIGLDNAEAFATFGWRVAIFLVAPALLVLAVRVIELGRRRPTGDAGATGGEMLDRVGSRIGAIALAVFAVAIVDGVAQSIANEPWHVLSLFTGALTVNLGMLIVTRLALTRLGDDISHTASIIAMTRNVGLAFAMTAAFFGPDLALYVALCQVPLLLGPMIVRLRKAPHAR